MRRISSYGMPDVNRSLKASPLGAETVWRPNMMIYPRSKQPNDMCAAAPAGRNALEYNDVKIAFARLEPKLSNSALNPAALRAAGYRNVGQMKTARDALPLHT